MDQRWQWYGYVWVHRYATRAKDRHRRWFLGYQYHVALVDITDRNEVVLQFGGGCHGCGMADVTLKQGIEQTLTRHIPEISAVLDATDHASGENPYYTRGAQGESAF